MVDRETVSEMVLNCAWLLAGCCSGLMSHTVKGYASNFIADMHCLMVVSSLSVSYTPEQHLLKTYNQNNRRRHGNYDKFL
jgi:hypothetical protein